MSEYGLSMPVADSYQEEDSLDCLDESDQKFFLERHDNWTIEQMDAIDRFISCKRRCLRQESEKEITISDFEKAKKEDIDNDGEEGEKD